MGPVSNMNTLSCRQRNSFVQIRIDDSTVLSIPVRPNAAREWFAREETDHA